jgi:hypothetical protein
MLWLFNNKDRLSAKSLHKNVVEVFGERFNKRCGALVVCFLVFEHTAKYFVQVNNCLSLILQLWHSKT